MNHSQPTFHIEDHKIVQKYLSFIANFSNYICCCVFWKINFISFKSQMSFSKCLFEFPTDFIQQQLFFVQVCAAASIQCQWTIFLKAQQLLSLGTKFTIWQQNQRKLHYFLHGFFIFDTSFFISRNICTLTHEIRCNFWIYRQSLVKNTYTKLQINFLTFL